MSHTELQGWKQTYCPECRKEYPVPIRDYHQLLEGGDVMHCPYGHKVPLRALPPAQIAQARPAAVSQAPTMRPGIEQITAHAGSQQHYCPYCRKHTLHARNGSETSWTCANSASHRGDKLHWLEEAVTTFARRCADVDRLEEEVGKLRREVVELRGAPK